MVKKTAYDVKVAERARPRFGRSRTVAIEREWTRGQAKTKPPEIKLPKGIGSYVGALMGVLINVIDLKKTPKELFQEIDNDKMRKIAQKIFASLDKINGSYLKANGDAKDSNYRLFKDMHAYWMSVARRGRLPLWSRYKKQTLNYQLTVLASLEKKLKKIINKAA